MLCQSDALDEGCLDRTLAWRVIFDPWLKSNRARHRNPANNNSRRRGRNLPHRLHHPLLI